MSSSAISAAKRRTETALKSYKVPSTTEPVPPNDTPNHQLLVSLLQSRLNWSNSIFVKYRPDPQQQPKRSTVIRRRFPMMKELGRATLILGPHVFHDTSFYEAIRHDSWIALGKEVGVQSLDEYSEDSSNKKPDTAITQVMDKEQALPQGDTNQQNLTTEHPTLQANINTDSAVDQSSQSAMTHSQTVYSPSSSATLEDAPSHRLVYRDIVMEFKDQPSERYLFPKDIIMQVIGSSSSPSTAKASATVVCSFMLPLDRTDADSYFWSAQQKIEHFGHQSAIPQIQKMAAPKDIDHFTSSDTHLPVNIRLLDTPTNVIDALQSIVEHPEMVRNKMIQQMSKVPDRAYVDHNVSSLEQQSMKALVQRVYTYPDIISGPVAAEKKRNEIGLAIKLGKRSESDLHEAEPPKTKQQIPGKEEEFRKCVYCSTRHTTMWRWGPAGEGTLCNGCGVLWLQGKILKGASVISKEEERQRMKEIWHKEYRKRQEEEWRQRQQQRRQQNEAEFKEAQEADYRMELCIKSKRRRALASQRQSIVQANVESQSPSQTAPAPYTATGATTPLHPHAVSSSSSPASTCLTPNDIHAERSSNDEPASIEYVNSQEQPPIQTSGDETPSLNRDLNRADENVKDTVNTKPKRPSASKLPHAPKNSGKALHVNTTTASSLTPPAQPSATTFTTASSSQTMSSASTPHPSSEATDTSQSYHIFNLPLIPLPTLSIELSNVMFSHPHCTVSLSHQKQFTVQLKKNETSITVNIPKQQLADARFEILGQVDSAGRDILFMSCQPKDVGFGPGNPLEAFGSVLYDPNDQQQRFNVRFLEKIDASGPVVKKILECWLADK